MAEFSEVIKQFNRMCKSISAEKCIHGECPMGCGNVGRCRKIAFEKPAHFVSIVMRWAAEHPAIYPTWENWLTTLGVQSFNELSTPIPEDIAQKLGIAPKEVPRNE